MNNQFPGQFPSQFSGQHAAQNSPFETLHVKSKKVSCDGASKASSHPLVYLNMGQNDFVICPYCSKYFTTKQGVPTSNKISKPIQQVDFS